MTEQLVDLFLGEAVQPLTANGAPVTAGSSCFDIRLV